MVNGELIMLRKQHFVIPAKVGIIFYALDPCSFDFAQDKFRRGDNPESAFRNRNEKPITKT